MTTTNATQRLDPVEMLSERFVAAICKAFPDQLDADTIDPLITPSKNPKFGDYQSNAAMSLAKRLGMKPREVADKIADNLELGDLAEPVNEESIAGPGFINVRLRPEALAKLVTELDRPGLGVKAEAQQTIVVDVCGVNLAKQMHIGHLRSTVIGDVMARTLAKMGHTVIMQNHVGDWGLPIAMVTAKLQGEVAAGRLDMQSVTLDDLDRLYKIAKEESSPDIKGMKAAERFQLGPKIEAELSAQIDGATKNLENAKKTLIKLQSSDEETVAIWQRLYDVTMTACMETCKRLHTDITQEATAGESSFREQLSGIIELLTKKNIAEEDDGALIVRNEGLDPTLVRKSDGGYLYATTDLAAVRKRVQELGADRVVYCVDARQALHFKQVFATAKRAGLARKIGADEDSTLEHAPFGMVLGDDGRPFKTRSGENVKLSDVIDEAIQRAAVISEEKNPDLSTAERARIAETVAVAALKYADLSSDRIKDYVFDWDRMLAFEGNTGPYLLFAYVRIRSIFRKAQDQGIATGFESAELLIREPEEKTLALALLRYPSTVATVARTLEPHRMCGYLYELAGSFSRFFEHCQVLRAEDESIRLSRLRLCDLTSRVLADGLDCLGIQTIDRM